MLHSFCLFVANCYHLNKENFFLLYIHFFFFTLQLHDLKLGVKFIS